jgi:purine-binding chemotaxis protein CheW
LIVSLDAIVLAIPATDVVQVVRAVAITRVPGCPDAVEGVVNVRGEVLPVYDLRGRFGLPPRAVHPDEYLVIIRTTTRGSATLRVTRADGFRAVEPEVVAAAASSRDPIIAGLARLEDGLLVVCDLDAARTTLAIARAEQVP